MATLLISLNETPVGHLEDQADGRVRFQFAASYLALDHRPVLGQHFEDNLRKTYLGKERGVLPAFFANLLPEGPMRELIARSMALDTPSDLALLEACAPDLPGAIRVTRIERTLADEPSLREGPPDDDAGIETGADRPLGLRFSLAGVQLKFSAIQEGERFTLPARSQAGEWIVKVAREGFEGLPQNEHFVMRWAAAAGFSVPETRLVPHEALGPIRRYFLEAGVAYAVRRFDREGARRIHQEDFNQVMGRTPKGNAKYQSTYLALGAVVSAILGTEGVSEFLRRLLFMAASGNGDAHLKNWSLIYPDGVHPQLSPLYDQVATTAWPRFDRKWALKWGTSDLFARADEMAFVSLAGRLGVEKDAALEILEKSVRRIQTAFKQTPPEGLSEVHHDSMRAHWASLPLFRKWGPLST